MKKFVLTNKQQQLIHLAFYFIDTFKKEKSGIYKDVDKLYGTIDKISTTYIDTYTKSLEYAHKQLTKLTKGEEFDCNPLVLGLGFSMVFIGTIKDIDEPIKDKLYELNASIYNNVEKALGDDIGFQNANYVVDMFTKQEKEIK
jgi:hypothetical protein